MNNCKKHRKVDHIDLDKIDNVDSMLRQFSNSGVFGAGRLGKAIDILEEAEKNE